MQNAKHPRTTPLRIDNTSNLQDQSLVRAFTWLKPLSLDTITNPLEFPFGIIDFQVALPVQGNQVYPVEIGLIFFNLTSGEQRHFHRFIDPGPIPVGELPTVQYRTENIHGIPHAEFPLAEQSIKKLGSELGQFLQSVNPGSGVQPLIFAKGPAKNSACLQWIIERLSPAIPMEEVREIEELIAYWQHLARDTSSVNINDVFTMDELNSGRCCEYHSGKSMRCALSQVRVSLDVLRKCAARIFPNLAHPS
eukprot:TRINITY_DN9221_c0_g1_i2.p1 TRINITY_DN9221_c0_g1~~TRINITY_DN9221_c0_g1_i2.p1  ORF type:complete len:250 (+),score=34.81 TRINITY_DN9221_c0_g1_i2:1-750(+)